MPRLLLILLAFFLCSPAAAQGTPVAGLGWLVGAWAGGGSHGGRESEASLEARNVLGDRFVELRYRIDRPFSFEGRALYRPADGGGWKADWYDSRGLVLPVSATLEGTILTGDWGTAGTERGRTVYRLLPDGRLEIVDYVLRRDGAYREFARQTFVRTAADLP